MKTKIIAIISSILGLFLIAGCGTVSVTESVQQPVVSGYYEDESTIYGIDVTVVAHAEGDHIDVILNGSNGATWSGTIDQKALKESNSWVSEPDDVTPKSTIAPPQDQYVKFTYDPQADSLSYSLTILGEKFDFNGRKVK